MPRLEWPPLVEEIAAHLPPKVYLVGGVVRDALRGIPSLDVDLTTPGNGLAVARALADAMGGAYYAVDADRGTGRVVLERGRVQIDVATFRGETLHDDLRGRDFTINAIAADITQRDTLIDPLGGQDDLLRDKVLRLCNPQSISSDPIRALRAVRMSLQFGLRISRETTAAIRRAQGALVDDRGDLHQPERTRDELLKITQKTRAATAFKIMDTLGMLDVILPGHDAPGQLSLMQAFERLTHNISYQRDDNTASNVVYGVAVMILDRYREGLNDHLGWAFSDGSTRLSVLMLGLLFAKNRAPLAEVLRLSGAQRAFLEGIDLVFEAGLLPDEPPTPRDCHRYYRLRGDEGVEATLLGLADYLAGAQPPDTITWGHLLDDIAAPLLAAYFQEYEHVIDPPPLLTGDELIEALGIRPGPRVGELLRALAEEQAAGNITTREEALVFAENQLR